MDGDRSVVSAQQCWVSYWKKVIHYKLLITSLINNLIILLITEFKSNQITNYFTFKYPSSLLYFSSYQT